MDENFLKELLVSIKNEEISIEDAIERLKDLPFEKIDQILFDHHRLIRKGTPEIIYGPGKDKEQLSILIKKLLKKRHPILITRVEQKSAESLQKKFPQLKYNKRARCLYCSFVTIREDLSKGVLILTAGTSDLAVAEEAKICLEVSGIYSEIIADVGVAGLHRFLSHWKAFKRVGVLIVIAGMEGALPSIVAGLVEAPVIAVPTSVGYGTNFKGLVPLLSMLNSCAPGIGVVNIDNGIGAALLAVSIIRTAQKIAS